MILHNLTHQVRKTKHLAINQVYHKVHLLSLNLVVILLPNPFSLMLLGLDAHEICNLSVLVDNNYSLFQYTQYIFC
nr:MAG TPA: hypothetical protein [Caudoviricetes sp.]